jgi:hypothetical protein
MRSDDELFDAEESERLKQLGMAAAAGNNKAALDLGRRIARALGRQFGCVTADDVGRILKRDYNIASLGPAAGSLFKDPSKCWKWTGDWRKSARKTNHSRMIRVWEYVY